MTPIRSQPSSSWWRRATDGLRPARPHRRPHRHHPVRTPAKGHRGTTQHIYRYELPGDDEWHPYRIGSWPLHFALRRRLTIDFWANAAEDSGAPYLVELRTFGTGHDIPDDAAYLGTVVDEPFVWHVFSRRAHRLQAPDA